MQRDGAEAVASMVLSDRTAGGQPNHP
jgi:hypothetical protein